MKYILITFYLLLFITISSQDYIEYREVGERVWLSADNVNLRSTPKDGKILENLPIGSELTFQSLENGWAQVVYEHGKKKVKGYLLEEFLSDQASYDEKTQNLFLFRTLSLEKNKYGRDVPKVEIRVAKNNKELAKKIIYGDNEGGFYVNVTGGKELKSVQNIISINFPQECCACPGGGTDYLFWNGKEIINAFTIYDGVDAPVFGINALIFPDDHGGSPNTIIMVYYQGEYDYDGGSVSVIEQSETEIHHWDGQMLNKIYPIEKPKAESKEEKE